MLIHAGASVDAADKDSWAPIHQAVKHDNLPLIAYLATQGADLNLVNSKFNCCTPVRIAIREKRVSSLQALAKAGAAIDPIDAETGRTPLLEAVVRGDETIVRIFLDAGARTDVTGNDGFDALRAAVKLGHQPVTELLLQRGANPNARSSVMALPLTIAVADGRADIARVLVTGGARLDVGRDGFHALQYAAYLGNARVIEAMLDAGVNPNAGSDTHPPPVVLAAERGHLPAVTLLVNRGADVNTQFQGWTAIRAARTRGHRPVIDYLQAHGAL